MSCNFHFESQTIIVAARMRIKKSWLEGHLTVILGLRTSYFQKPKPRSSSMDLTGYLQMALKAEKAPMEHGFTLTKTAR